MYKHVGTYATLGLALLLPACGGNSGGGVSNGGSPPAINAVAEGAWSGINSVDNNFDMLILENGAFYSLYGTVTTEGFSALGFDVGSTNVSGNTVTATFTQYDYLRHRLTGNLSAAVVSGTSIKDGKATATGGTAVTTFDAVPLAISYPGYNYNTAAAISDVSGAWVGSMLEGSATAFTIDSEGILLGPDLGCRFTGTVKPRPSGKNVFDVAIEFGSSPCIAANQKASGIAVSYPLANGKRQLIAAAETSARTHGSMFYAER